MPWAHGAQMYFLDLVCCLQLGHTGSPAGHQLSPISHWCPLTVGPVNVAVWAKLGGGMREQCVFCKRLQASFFGRSWTESASEYFSCRGAI